MSSTLVDRHLQNFEFAQREKLSKLRTLVASELPSAEEVIKYGIPTFVIKGVPVLGYDGYKNHNSIFPYCGAVNLGLTEELSKYKHTKGSIHFELSEDFPKALVRKIIKRRIEQINASYPKKTGEFLEFYSNGRVKASGKIIKGELHGHWKWFRKNGVIMRSGSFAMGRQVGIWVTYDSYGEVYKRSSRAPL